VCIPNLRGFNAIQSTSSTAQLFIFFQWKNKISQSHSIYNPSHPIPPLVVDPI